MGFIFPGYTCTLAMTECTELSRFKVERKSLKTHMLICTLLLMWFHWWEKWNLEFIRSYCEVSTVWVRQMKRISAKLPVFLVWILSLFPPTVFPETWTSLCKQSVEAAMFFMPHNMKGLDKTNNTIWQFVNVLSNIGSFPCCSVFCFVLTGSDTMSPPTDVNQTFCHFVKPNNFQKKKNWKDSKDLFLRCDGQHLGQEHRLL